MGGFTFAPMLGLVMSVRRCPMVTSRRKSMWGKAAAIVIAASIAFRELRCSRLMLASSVSCAR